MGAFFSNLIGSYAGAMRDKHNQERKRQDEAIDSQIDLIKLAVSTGQADVGAAAERIDELNKQRGIKSKFSFKNLIGKFGDISGETKGADTGGTPPGRGGPGGAKGGATATPSGPSAARQSAETPDAPPVPSRPGVFKTSQQVGQEKIDFERNQFEQVTKPQLDYEHKLRLEEIEKQYGVKLTPRTKILGSSVPPSVTADTGGKPIDPKKQYTVLFNNQNQPVAAMEEYEKASTSRLSGPEAKVDSLKKDLMAEAKGQGRELPEEQADIEARRMVLMQARAQLAATLESTKGKVFANKVRSDLEKGVMSPATARGVIGYVGTEAKRRFADDMGTIASGKSIPEIEDDIYQELGTSREQIATYLRQGAKGPGAADKKKAFKFDPNLNPVPERPAAQP
jgi:hypothetical protein